MATTLEIPAADPPPERSADERARSGIFMRSDGTGEALGPTDEAVHRAALDAAPDAYLVIDARTAEICFANAKCLDVLGRAPDALVGQTLTSEGLGVLGCACAPSEAPPTVSSGGSSRSLVCRIQGAGRDRGVRDVALTLSRAHGGQLAVVVARDVTEQLSRERRMRFEATHDELTGLHNRAHLRREIAALRRRGVGPVSVIILDVDGLKRVNDTRGHDAGDRLLTRLAATLRGAFRERDTIVRLGGDEFAVLMPDTDSATRDAVARAYVEDLARSDAGSGASPISVSIGAATTAHPDGIRAAMKVADARMYAMKSRRRSG